MAQILSTPRPTSTHALSLRFPSSLPTRHQHTAQAAQLRQRRRRRSCRPMTSPSLTRANQCPHQRLHPTAIPITTAGGTPATSPSRPPPASTAMPVAPRRPSTVGKLQEPPNPAIECQGSTERD
uniref:Uncharacterized protein n=1 Tax=Setaria viridis TaxID=4556 RepID=A0A4U6W4X8_SETVI|nr:hypothetical protein SEVIR_1G057900v2 [Setaria viridis]